MKVLHILSQMPDYTGSGKYVQEMIRQAGAKGHEAFLVAGVSADFEIPPGLIRPDHCRVIRFDGRDITFPIMGMSDIMPYPSTVCSALTRLQIIEYQTAFARIIGAAVADFRPEIIHSNHLWMASAVTRDVVPHVPMVTTCHGTCLRQHRLCPELGDSLRPSLGRLDRVIALFEGQRADIVELLHIDADRVHVVSGGFDQECFFAEGQDSDAGTVRILYAGKLSFAKGVPWLLTTLKHIRASWHLHLVGSGSGPEMDVCLRLAAELGDRVTVHGVLSHEALGRLMRASDVFVLPSFYEGLPLVLLEALACGCRIVSTSLPGVRELFDQLHPEMVRLVELPPLETVDRPYKADAAVLERRLGEALRATLADVVRGVGTDREYVRTITDPFCWERVFARIEDVYGQAVEDRRRTRDGSR